MVNRCLLLGFVGLACSTAPAADLRISGPYTHDNLSIYLLHSSTNQAGKQLLTLQEAMDQQKVVVYETGQVNQSDTPREAGGLMSWAASKAVGSWV